MFHEWNYLGRSLASGTVIHGSFDPTNRDAVVRWTAAFVLATMFFIRGERKMIHDAYAGILNEDQIKKLQRATHPPIHAGDNVRWHLHQLFTVSGSESVSFSVAQERIQQLSTLEHQLIALQDDLGALERIKATPLPLVYVTHLRTWLVLFLFSMPFIWQSSLGWATIPVVFLTSFAMLGLEGAAVEMESPWTHRTNHLSMDAYCLLLLSNIQQIIQEDADRRMDITLPQFLRSWRKGSEQPPLSPGAKLDLSDSSLSVASYQHNPLKNGMSSAPKLETIEGHLGDSYASIDTVDC
jgi:putative membrane protein